MGAGPPTPEGWAPPGLILSSWARLVGVESFIRSAAYGAGSVEELRTQDLDALAPRGMALEAGVRELFASELPPDVAPSVAQLAAARIGAVIKCVGIAEMTGLFPLSTDKATIDVVDHLQKLAADGLAKQIAGEKDEDVLRRAMRAERVILSKDGVDLALAQMSVQEVIKLRTPAWGKANTARGEFMRVVRGISAESADDAEFERLIRRAILEYEKEAAEARHQLNKFLLGILVPKQSTWSTSVLGGAAAALIGLPNMAFMVAAAGAMAHIGSLGQEGLDFYRTLTDSSKHVGKALLAPYQAVRGR